MPNYKGYCVECNAEINDNYNYCYNCLQKEKKKGNYPQVKYSPCEKCLGEDCICCDYKL